jgi:catechol 2,3-dioxygenase-like lactoylglutathione lyase family enzyme
MLNVNKAFSSFSVNDIQQAKEFYGKTLGLELARGPEGTLVLPLSGGTKALMYPKPNHQAATFTVLNFPVDNVEKAVDLLSQRGSKGVTLLMCVACDLNQAPCQRNRVRL